MTHLRFGFGAAAGAAIFVVSLAAATLGVSACTQGTTPDCGDSACGAGPGVLPDASVTGDAPAGEDGG
jgi:hypothetical protein